MTANDSTNGDGERCDGGETFIPTTRIMKLRELDGSSFGVTLPKDDLRQDGLLDVDDELTDDWQIVVRHVGSGKWELETAKRPD